MKYWEQPLSFIQQTRRNSSHYFLFLIFQHQQCFRQPGLSRSHDFIPMRIFIRDTVRMQE